MVESKTAHGGDRSSQPRCGWIASVESTPYHRDDLFSQRDIKRTVSVLYLAEVRKQKSGGFMAKVTTELKLLACQRNDQSWASVPGDEAIDCDAAGEFESGVLVAVNLNNNRQLQGAPEPAAAQIIRDLQRYSRMQEKLKEQEEEIEGWKQSLTLQAQELNKREMELEAELEQLEHLNEEGGGGAGGVSNEELEQARAEADRIREEFERKTQELEQAWAHLRGEQQRLAEQQADAANSTAVAAALDPAKAQPIHELADYLASIPFPVAALQEHLNLTLEAINAQAENSDYYGRQLDEQQADAQQQQTELDGQIAAWETQQQQVQSLRLALDQAKQDLTHQRHQLALKTNLKADLIRQQNQQGALIASLTALAPVDSGNSGGEDKSGVDVAALQAMEMGALQQIVEDLEKELDRLGQFVESQEEELKLQREAVTEIEEQLKTASVYDTSALEQELADEQEQRKLLDETLVGQRRTLAEKRTTLRHHLKILRQRQGIADPEAAGSGVDLGPVLAQLAAEQEARQGEIAVLETEIAALETEVATLAAGVEEQTTRYDQQQHELRSLESQLQESRASVALLWGRVNLYEELVEPLQESVQSLQGQSQILLDLLAQAQQTQDYQQEAIANLKTAVQDLLGSP
ncbi:pilus motility taxis protein HmpF [Spirulina sp. CCNP1310]|uniref:pilus motility taxis protein HmpF n=1 Tax=Spirulina sp. CCNP1310 TaxID=3110249 RepID=UPI002B21E8C1|nr:pilus motility taxis protein HmpF [Spirulina sp. CCNP1310]MEA5421533.1 pilus motility taxis protein HmpF [Spirulina sp. CCNP1310]